MPKMKWLLQLTAIIMHVCMSMIYTERYTQIETALLASVPHTYHTAINFIVIKASFIMNQVILLRSMFFWLFTCGLVYGHTCTSKQQRNITYFLMDPLSSSSYNIFFSFHLFFYFLLSSSSSTHHQTPFLDSVSICVFCIGIVAAVERGKDFW